jgi:hypothetical protein
MFTSVQYDSRARDIALGIPFNIAGYFLLTQLIADQTGFKPGTFSHTIVFVIDSVIVQLLQGLAESEEYIFQIEDQEGNLISARKSVTDSSEIKSLYKWAKTTT